MKDCAGVTIQEGDLVATIRFRREKRSGMIVPYPAIGRVRGMGGGACKVLTADTRRTLTRAPGEIMVITGGE